MLVANGKVEDLLFEEGGVRLVSGASETLKCRTSLLTYVTLY